MLTCVVLATPPATIVKVADALPATIITVEGIDTFALLLESERTTPLLDVGLVNVIVTVAEFPLTIALGLIVRVAIETVAGTVEPVEFVGVLICPPPLAQPEINAVMTKIEMRNESWRDMNSPALIAVG